MITIKGNKIVYFDVDDTLVAWTYGALPVDGSVLITCNGFDQYLIPHKKHIEQMKAHKARGHTVVVWSAGGYEWAEAVVKSLQLQDFVDLCISKPQWTYDDLQAQDFMPVSKWMKDE